MTTATTKPHLRYRNGWWRCDGLGTVGLRRAPDAAYENWLDQLVLAEGRRELAQIVAEIEARRSKVVDTL